MELKEWILQIFAYIVNVLLIEINCGHPGLLVNGFYNITGEFKFNSIVRYSCFGGFQLEGSSMRICLKNGSWSGTLPKCKSRCTSFYAIVRSNLFFMKPHHLLHYPLLSYFTFFHRPFFPALLHVFSGFPFFLFFPGFLILLLSFFAALFFPAFAPSTNLFVFFSLRIHHKLELEINEDLHY